MQVTFIRCEPPLAIALDGRITVIDATLSGVLDQLGWPTGTATALVRRGVAMVLHEQSADRESVTLWSESGERAHSSGAPGEPHLVSALAQLPSRLGRPRKVDPLEARAMHERGMTHADIAAELGVGRTAVTMALRSKS